MSKKSLSVFFRGGYGASYAYYGSTGEYDYLNGDPANRMIYSLVIPINAENVDEYIGFVPNYDFTLNNLSGAIAGYQTPSDIEVPAA